ncbi:MAG TPA: MMPL family transporter [Candidatus Limnocylindrales bacterium]|nr:MMPL family transporter [Candidatus Limnocylindrales bacterium]
MRKLCRWIIFHQRISVALVLVVTALLATGLPGLRTEVTAKDLMAADSPAGRFYEDAKRQFGSDDLTLVLVQADDVFQPKALEAIARLTNESRAIPGVRSVTSLVTVGNIRGTGDSIDTDPLFPPVLPKDPAVLADIRRQALRNPLLAGNLVSEDAKATAVLVYTQNPGTDSKFDPDFAAALERVIASVHQASGLEIWQIGGPFTKATLVEFVQQDQVRLMPLALVLLLVVLWLMFRVSHAVAIPITTGLLSIVWTFGLMGLLGYSITVITALIPVLLICIGFTEDVHIIAEYHQAYAHSRDKRKALLETMETLAVPLLVTTATTVLGFLTLVTSDIRLLKEFGIFAPIGFTANFVISIVLVPALLRIWPIPAKMAAVADDAPIGRTHALMDWIGRFDLEHGRMVLVIAVLVAVASGVAATQIRVDNDLLSYFHKGSVLRERTEQAHERLAGVTNFSVIVEGGRPDAIKDPALLRTIAALQDHLAKVPGIDKTLSVADFVRTMQREIDGGDEKRFVVPDSSDLIAQYLLMLDGEDLARYVNADYSSASITVRHNITSTWELNRVLADLRDWSVANFPKAVSVTPTGESILINEASDYMVFNMVSDLVSLLIAVALVNAAMFMSIRAGLLSLIPNLVPIAVIFGIMGVFGIPLNVGTCMIAAIAIGIAVDDTVHYMARYSAELDRHHDQEKAMFATLHAEGKSILSTSLALAAGFAILVFSNFVPTAYFGGLSAVTMLLAIVTELTMTPILMVSTRLVTAWNIVGLKLEGDITATALLRDFTKWEARKVIMLGTIETFEPGQHVIQRGEESDGSMYLVLSGALRASVTEGGREKLLSKMKSGDLFGEVALIDTKPRSADVVAETGTEILRLSSADLERVRRRFPGTGAKLFRNLAWILGQRVRDLTEKSAVAV